MADCHYFLVVIDKLTEFFFVLDSAKDMISEISTRPVVIFLTIFIMSAGNKRRRDGMQQSSKAEFSAAMFIDEQEDFHCINPTQQEVDEFREREKRELCQLTVPPVEFLSVRAFNEQLTDEQRKQSTLVRVATYISLLRDDVEDAANSIRNDVTTESKRWIFMQCWDGDVETMTNGHYFLVVIDKVTERIFVLDSAKDVERYDEVVARVNVLVENLFGEQFEGVSVDDVSVIQIFTKLFSSNTFVSLRSALSRPTTLTAASTWPSLSAVFCLGCSVTSHGSVRHRWRIRASANNCSKTSTLNIARSVRLTSF